MELFAPLHPPPPPSEEICVLAGMGVDFVKVLVGRGVSVWVAVAVGVSVAVVVSVAVAVGVCVTVGVNVLVAVAVLVEVLVSVGVSDAIICWMEFVNAQAELNPASKTKIETAKNRLINKIAVYSKTELSQNLWFGLTPFRGFGGVFIGAANAEQLVFTEVGA